MRRRIERNSLSKTVDSQNLPLERYLLELAEASAPRMQASVKVDLARLLLEIRRKARILPPARIDSVAAIMRHVAASPHTPEIRTLVRIAAAITRESGELDENAIWALSPEALGLLDALIQSKMS